MLRKFAPAAMRMPLAWFRHRAPCTGVRITWAVMLIFTILSTRRSWGRTLDSAYREPTCPCLKPCMRFIRIKPVFRRAGMPTTALYHTFNIEHIVCSCRANCSHLVPLVVGSNPLNSEAPLMRGFRADDGILPVHQSLPVGRFPSQRCLLGLVASCSLARTLSHSSWVRIP